MHTPLRLSLLATAALLAACGGGNDSPPRGSIAAPTESTQSFTTTSFSAQVNASAATAPILQVAGAPTCGVDVQRIRYNTVGGSGESTTASAALMVPTGTAAACTGARPIVLYAHGTTADRNYNLASFAPTNAAYGEALLVAAMYAAQGFVVVAPNYAGYDSSALNYHPYLNANQQSSDMVDALAAARSVLASGRDNGKLFITGYSQGGYVAMATHRAMQAAGQTVTASAPLSAPSAISLLVDYNFSGAPALGSTVFTPLLSTSWQRQFGNVYSNITDVYEAPYAATIENLLPSTQSIAALVAANQFPATQALYAANAQPPLAVPALAPFGFYGPNNLIKSTFLAAAAADIAAQGCPGNAFPATAGSLSTTTPLACAPTNGFRRAAVANDLRNWLPTRPMLMCGGANDPTVNFLSTRATAGYFSARGATAASLTVLDLEAAATGPTDPYAAAKAGFAQAVAATAAGPGGTTSVVTSYHGGLVPPFCNAAARGFFQGVIAAGI